MSAAKGTVLVTGASGGIGLELARRFAREGHGLVLVARSADRLSGAAAELRGAHRIEARTIAIDLSREEAPRQVFDEVRLQGIDVDVLVNNAGVGSFGPFASADLAAQLDMIRLNVSALTHLTGLFLPPMLARRRGSILNVASTAAFQPGPLMAVYCATKAYVLSFSEALAHELRGTGVTVTTLCPGPTHSGFQSRAGMQDSRLFDFGAMDGAAVAEAGYRGATRGDRIVVPGIANKLGVSLVRFAPRRLVPHVVERMQAAKTRRAR